MACTQCTNGCVGACATNACSGVCSLECTACAHQCSHSCTTGCGSAGGGGSEPSTPTCTSCQNTCKDFCNKGCKDSALTASVSRKIEASNIQTIAELISHELSRRPSVTMPHVLNFKEKTKATNEDLNKLIANLNKTNQTINITLSDKDKILKSLAENIIEKLKKASEEEILIKP